MPYKLCEVNKIMCTNIWYWLGTQHNISVLFMTSCTAACEQEVTSLPHSYILFWVLQCTSPDLAAILFTRISKWLSVMLELFSPLRKNHNVWKVVKLNGKLTSHFWEVTQHALSSHLSLRWKWLWGCLANVDTSFSYSALQACLIAIFLTLSSA